MLFRSSSNEILFESIRATSNGVAIQHDGSGYLFLTARNVQSRNDSALVKTGSGYLELNGGSFASGGTSSSFLFTNTSSGQVNVYANSVLGSNAIYGFEVHGDVILAAYLNEVRTSGPVLFINGTQPVWYQSDRNIVSGGNEVIRIFAPTSGLNGVIHTIGGYMFTSGLYTVLIPAGDIYGKLRLLSSVLVSGIDASANSIFNDLSNSVITVMTQQSIATYPPNAGITISPAGALLDSTDVE